MPGHADPIADQSECCYASLHRCIVVAVPLVEGNYGTNHVVNTTTLVPNAIQHRHLLIISLNC